MTHVCSASRSCHNLHCSTHSWPISASLGRMLVLGIHCPWLHDSVAASHFMPASQQRLQRSSRKPGSFAQASQDAGGAACRHCPQIVPNKRQADLRCLHFRPASRRRLRRNSRRPGTLQQPVRSGRERLPGMLQRLGRRCTASRACRAACLPRGSSC